MNELTINGEIHNINNLTIDFKNKEINIEDSDINSPNYTWIRDIFWHVPSITNPIYLKDSSEKRFTFYDCYIGNHSIKNNAFKLSIIYNANITDYYIEDIKNYKVNKMIVSMNYKKLDIVDIEESIGRHLDFTIGKTKYELNLIFGPRYYELTIQSSNKLTTENLLDKFVNFYEFLILCLGYYLEITEIKFTDKNKTFSYTYPFSAKFSGTNNYNSYSCVLAKINKENLSEVYKNWLIVRKNSHIIYDIYMNIFSVKYFIEIALSTLINCMEGYYKCIHKSTLKKQVHTKKGLKTVDKTFKDIMKEYINSPVGKIIFTNSDRNKFKIFHRLKNHRNFFAHLNEKKGRFYGENNLFMLYKLRLMFRAFILTDIYQEIETSNLEECVSEIEKNINFTDDL